MRTSNKLTDDGRQYASFAADRNEAGLSHPFLAGKPAVYDAPCIHCDEVTRLPENATLLSGNVHSPAQAAIEPVGRPKVWGVQYHPEFDITQL